MVKGFHAQPLRRDQPPPQAIDGTKAAVGALHHHGVGRQLTRHEQGPLSAGEHTQVSGDDARLGGVILRVQQGADGARDSRRSIALPQELDAELLESRAFLGTEHGAPIRPDEVRGAAISLGREPDPSILQVLVVLRGVQDLDSVIRQSDQQGLVQVVHPGVAPAFLPWRRHVALRAVELAEVRPQPHPLRVRGRNHPQTRPVHFDGLVAGARQRLPRQVHEEPPACAVHCDLACMQQRLELAAQGQGRGQPTPFLEGPEPPPVSPAGQTHADRPGAADRAPQFQDFTGPLHDLARVQPPGLGRRGDAHTDGAVFLHAAVIEVE